MFVLLAETPELLAEMFVLLAETLELLAVMFVLLAKTPELLAVMFVLLAEKQELLGGNESHGAGCIFSSGFCQKRSRKIDMAIV